MLVYLIKSSLLLFALYGCYAMLLKRETFHRFNRIVLVAILLTAILFPFVEISVKEPWQIPQPLKPIYELQEKQRTEIAAEAQRSEIGRHANTGLIPDADIAVSLPDVEECNPRSTGFPIWLIIYWAGVIWMLFRFICEAWGLYRYLQGGMHLKDECGNNVVIHAENFAPRSFMHNIIISAKDYDEMRHPVMMHEQAHIRNGHSWDILLLECLLIIQWYNPIVRMLGRELRSVHEYEADRAVLEGGINANTYQQLLVMKAVSTRLQTLAHCLNHGSLKERIIMMNKKKTNGMNMLKAVFVPAIMFVAALSFAQSESSNVPDADAGNVVMEKSYNKIKKMEEASSRYAENLKTFPATIKGEDVVNIMMNKSGRVIVRRGKQLNEMVYQSSLYGVLMDARPTYLVVISDVSAPADELDDMVDWVYRYYTDNASDSHPLYFYRATVDYSKKYVAPQEGTSFKRRMLVDKTSHEYEKLWEKLQAEK